MTRKQAMEKRKDWGFRGLNPTARDRAGQRVSAMWNKVVEATDGGTESEIAEVVAEAEQAEAEFYSAWK